MTNQTRYVATEDDVQIIIRGREDWTSSLTYPHIIGKMTMENVAYLLNNAYQRGREEQSADIRKALGVR